MPSNYWLDQLAKYNPQGSQGAQTGSNTTSGPGWTASFLGSGGSQQQQPQNTTTPINTTTQAPNTAPINQAGSGAGAGAGGPAGGGVIPGSPVGGTGPATPGGGVDPNANSSAVDTLGQQAGTMPTMFNSPEMLNYLLSLMPPELQSVVFPELHNWDPTHNANLPMALGGPFGFGMGLETHEGGGPIGMATNLSFADYLSGASRGQQRENVLADLIGQGQATPAYMAGQALGGSAEQLANPDFLNEKYGMLEQEARVTNAQGLNNARNRLQDLGLAGGGMGQAPALIAAERGSNRDLQSALAQLAAMRTDEQRNNLMAASQGAGTSADIWRALGMEPQLNLASSLGGPQNIQSPQFQNQLNNVGQLASGVALSNQSPSTWQQIAPLLSSGIGAIGNIVGAKILS